MKKKSQKLVAIKIIVPEETAEALQRAADAGFRSRKAQTEKVVIDWHNSQPEIKEARAAV